MLHALLSKMVRNTTTLTLWGQATDRYLEIRRAFLGTPIRPRDDIPRDSVTPGRVCAGTEFILSDGEGAG